MLKHLNQFYGSKLGASDGDIGHIKDFYFDDHNWAIRYVVADTGSWLPGQQVLLSPHAFGGLHQAGNILQVNLTRKQIENSPSVETHKPVSRQYEEEYHRYYGWPFYWQGGGIWGMSGFPILEASAKPLPHEQATANDPDRDRADANLRSTKAVDGYHVLATDGIAGHVCNFRIDAQSWVIRQLIVKIGHRLSGREVQISTSLVDRVSYEESTVRVNLTKAVIESPAHHLDPVGAAD